jgi:hypothetical protein
MTAKEMREYARLLLEISSDYYDAGAIHSAKGRLEQSHHWTQQAEIAEQEEARQFNPHA